MRSVALALLLLGGVARADEGGVRGGLVISAGLTQRSDQVVAGAGAACRGLGARWLGVDAAVQAGLGLDFLTVRPSLHAIADFLPGRFRLYPLVGASLLFYRARGDFAAFCDKAELDCDSVDWGFDLGLGVGWQWLTLEAYLGTGELPLVTVAGKATWLF